MPLPTLSKESLSSSEQKKKDEEKTFSVTILVNENEKNKIVDLLHKAKSIISKKVEKVMGKKPKTGISNVDALQTVLENWLDKTESEEREEDRLLEQLIQGQEDQVETMLLDGKPVPVTFPTVPTVSVCNLEESYYDKEELGEDMEVARLTSPVHLQPPPRRTRRPSETVFSPTRSLSPCETVPRPFGNRPDSELYPPRLRRPSSLYGAGAAAASSRPPSRQVSVSPSVAVANQDREEEQRLLLMQKLNINQEDQNEEDEDEWEYEEEAEEEEVGTRPAYTEKRPSNTKYTRPDSFIVPIGGVWNPRDDPMEAEVKWSTVEVPEEEPEAPEERNTLEEPEAGDETCGGEGDPA